MRGNIKDYLKSIGNCKNIIFSKDGGMKKRESAKFPIADMHSRLIEINGLPDFLIYEHYGTWYLQII